MRSFSEPTPPPRQQRVTLAERDGSTVCYDSQNQRALRTLHTPKHSSNPTPRRKDHEIDSLSANAFTNTGFDRGHLASAADLPESQDTFLTSKPVAQIPALNRGEWRWLENQIRKQKPVQVITAAIYNNCGNEKIEAPCYVYKIAYPPEAKNADLKPDAPAAPPSSYKQPHPSSQTPPSEPR